ncbi:hypothetical protein EBZ37_07380, partial [bacterium]|nr:hypothetical protein [bacterium]
MSNSDLSRGLSESLSGNMNLLKICMSQFWGGVEQTAFNDLCDLASCGLSARLVCLAGSPLYEEVLKVGSGLERVQLIPLEARPREVLDFQFGKFIREQVADGVSIVHSHHTSLLG